MVLTLIPLGSLNATLNDNYTLHIRWDYLLHALVYLPLSFFISAIFVKNAVKTGSDEMEYKIPWILVILVAGLIVVSFELVQKALPYRSFNINDMMANGIGAILGLFLFRLFRRPLLRYIQR